MTSLDEKINDKNAGVYVHIPFCRSKCPYCDFFSCLNREKAAQYVARVNALQWEYAERLTCKADTLYIGGGTPPVIEPELIGSIISTAGKAFGDGLCEITVECNPYDCDEKLLKKYASYGVNRISIGMQSAVDGERRALGRTAGREKVESAVKNARKAGIENISLDLMLGIPYQTKESLKESLSFISDMGVQHVSAYMLSLEKGTYFYKNAAKLNLPDEDETAEMYLFACEELNKIGLEQYEISNFAFPGFESRHNIKYWNLSDYVGIGAAAHSFLNGKRFYYERDIDGFISGGAPVPDGEGGTREEKIMLGLRLTSGIQKSLLSDKAKAALPELKEQGLISESKEKIALTGQGFLISNPIIAILTE